MDDFTDRPVRPIDVRGCHTADDYLSAFSKMSFQARRLGECLGVMEDMARDPECTRVLTVSGALVPAGLGGVIAAMIEEGLVDIVISTGANVTHDLLEGAGEHHYRGREDADDERLKELEINRIYDTFVTEKSYMAMENWMDRLLDDLPEKVYTPSVLLEYLGLHVPGETSFVRAAADRKVPVFVPAFSDSELALNLVIYNESRGKNIRVDELKEIRVFAELLGARERAGVIILGGGVPRNWAQQIFPYLEHLERVQGKKVHLGYHYGVRIGTDIPHHGGLSGSTFQEAVSWGKYKMKSTRASLLCDITIALPLLVGALLERLENS